jgi:hypothetical protein
LKCAFKVGLGLLAPSFHHEKKMPLVTAGSRTIKDTWNRPGPDPQFRVKSIGAWLRLCAFQVIHTALHLRNKYPPLMALSFE